MKRKENQKFFLGVIIGVAIVAAVLIFYFSLSGMSFASKIAVINIRGTISSSSSLLTETVTPEDIFSMIEQAERDPAIRGILFQINSGGGSVVASREIAYAVKEMKKPTLCWMGDVAASGAYWIASACDHIMADPLSLTGSIGVTASYLEFSGLFEEYGITYEQITSGESKDAGSPFREITDEERERLQYITDEVFRYFLDDVRESRSLTNEQIEQITSGDIFLGKDAIEVGLIDSLGTVKDAKEKAKELAGVSYADFVTFKKQGLSIFDLLGMF